MIYVVQINKAIICSYGNAITRVINGSYKSSPGKLCPPFPQLPKYKLLIDQTGGSTGNGGCYVSCVYSTYIYIHLYGNSWKSVIIIVVSV